MTDGYLPAHSTTFGTSLYPRHSPEFGSDAPLTKLGWSCAHHFPPCALAALHFTPSSVKRASLSCVSIDQLQCSFCAAQVSVQSAPCLPRKYLSTSGAGSPTAVRDVFYPSVSSRDVIVQRARSDHAGDDEGHQGKP